MTLALVAILAGTSHAAINGKKPVFMDKQQLAEMRAGAASNSIKETEDPDFFTGRPYLASTEGYAFKYRNYRPGIARWTSEDPSGFPDGPNSSSYAPVPTDSLDIAGLVTWDFNGNVGSQDTYTGTSGVTYTVQTQNLGAISSNTFNQSMDGWTFSHGTSNAELQITTYSPHALSDIGKVVLTAGATSVQSLAQGEQYGWIQVVTSNTGSITQPAGTFIDILNGATSPFATGGGSLYFADQPSRLYSQLANSPGNMINWSANLYFAKFDEDKNVTLFGGVNWQFSIYE